MVEGANDDTRAETDEASMSIVRPIAVHDRRSSRADDAPRVRL